MPTIAPLADQLQRRLQQQLLGEGVADLHLGAARLALRRQLVGREGGAVNAVAAGSRAHGHDGVADALRRAPDQVVRAHEPQAHGVDQRVALVAPVEPRLAAYAGDAHAVAVVAHALDHPGEEVADPRAVQVAEAQGVERGHRPGAHGEDVSEDASDARCRSLVRLHCRGVVVGLDLERQRPSVAHVHHARVLARSLDHPRRFRRQKAKERLRILVAAVLRPHGGEHSQLGERRRPPQNAQRRARTPRARGRAPRRARR